MKTAIVFGGCGAVGRSFCQHLHSIEYNIICVDDMRGSTSIFPDDWSDTIYMSPYFSFLQIDIATFLTQYINTYINVEYMVNATFDSKSDTYINNIIQDMRIPYTFIICDIDKDNTERYNILEKLVYNEDKPTDIVIILPLPVNKQSYKS